MRVCVLKGGSSPEREISLKTGRAVASALRERGFCTVEVDVKSEDESWLERYLPLDCDVFFIALHGGLGEGGSVQAFFEKKKVAFTGSPSQASFKALNKLEAKKCFIEAGLKQVDWVAFQRDGELFFPEFGFPMVVKPADVGSSMGLSVVRFPEEFDYALRKAFEFSETVIVEKFVFGKEITVSILGERVLEPIEIRPKDSLVFDYESKYVKGKTEYIIPANVDEDTKVYLNRVAYVAFSCLGCRDFGRVDLILSEEDVFVLEVNTIPGMTETSLLPKAAKFHGLDFPTVCETIVNLALNRSYEREKEEN